MDDPLPLPLPIVVDPADPTSPVAPPIIIIGGGGSSSSALLAARPKKDMAHGTDWFWFFELVQAFRDVHGVRPYPPPDESLKQEGPGSALNPARHLTSRVARTIWIVIGLKECHNG